MSGDEADDAGGADRSTPNPGSAGGGLGPAHLVLLLGSASYFCFLFSWFLLPAFLTPIVDDLGLSSTRAGILNGAVPLTYIPLGLLSGLLVERIGWRYAIAIGLGCIGLGHALRAGATDFWTMLLPTFLLGVGGTGITFGLPKLVSRLFPPERSGPMSAVYLVGSSLGSAAAFGLARPVLDPALGGWRPSFRWSGLAVLAFAACWLVLTRAPLASSDSPASADRDDPVGDATFTPESARRDLTRVIGHRGLRLVVVIGTTYLFFWHGIQAWLPTVLEVRGFSAAFSGLFASLLVASHLVGVLVVPALSVRLGTRRWTVVGCGGFATVGALGLLGSGGSAALVIAVVVAAGVGVGGLSPLIRSLPIELEGIGPRLTATATGLVYSVGEIGGFLGPFVVGGLHDATGSYAAGIAVLSLGGLVVAGAGLAMNEPGESDASA